jgi:predicted MFS family arabinose efflux permease
LKSLAGTFGEAGEARIAPEVPWLMLLVFVSASARTFGWAARGAFVSGLVPRDTLANAVNWNSCNFQISSVLGPILGGYLLVSLPGALLFSLDAVAALFFMSCLIGIRSPKPTPQSRPAGSIWAGLAEGVRFVSKTKVILASITLDLFAVLFAGATALLPRWADEILHVGVAELGWMKAAPPLGALIMGFWLVHHPPNRAGLALLWSVAGYGVAMIVFGLSTNLWLSLLALFVSGALDNVSVVVRHTLVQLLTPDPMRGRVSAVNNIFIGSSNDLGAVESGLVSARFGPVISVVSGGILALLVVIGVNARWPAVRRLGRLDG